MTSARARFLLLQIRRPGDPILAQEVRCFARALGCPPEQIRTCDLLLETPSAAVLDSVDVVLIGGSGDYSATGQDGWLLRALDGLRDLHDRAKPTFASCWGCQAFARALGGDVQKDLPHAEIGTLPLRLTADGLRDPVFGPLGRTFLGQMGHEDRVVRLPKGAVLLASSDLVENQAYRFDRQPIYCTQFHPELDRERLLERVRSYPEYIVRICGERIDRFADRCRDTPGAEQLLTRFVDYVLQ